MLKEFKSHQHKTEVFFAPLDLYVLSEWRALLSSAVPVEADPHTNPHREPRKLSHQLV